MLNDDPVTVPAALAEPAADQPGSRPWLPWLALGLVVGALAPTAPDQLMPFAGAHVRWWLFGIPLAIAAAVAARRMPLAARWLCFAAACLLGGALAAERATDLVVADATSSVDDDRLVECVGTVASVRWPGYRQRFLLQCDAMTTPVGQPSPGRVLVDCSQPLPGVVVGDTVRVRGAYRLDARGGVIGAVALDHLAPRDRSARGWAWSALDRLESHRLLGQSLLLGQGDAPESQDFRRAGLLHVLAVSGMHLAIAAVLGLWLLRIAGVGWGARQLALAALIIGYTWLTAASPATMRALVMGLCVVGMGLLAREPHRLAAVSLSALILAVVDPATVGNIGFQLSLVAVFGILTLGLDLVRLRKAIAPLAPWPLDRPVWRAVLWCASALCDGLVIGIAASLATMPLIAWQFHTANPWGPLATLIATPPTTLALWLGLPCVALAGAFPNGPWEGLYAGLEWNLDALAAVARWSATWPYASMPVAAPGPIALLMWPLLFLPVRDRVDVITRAVAVLALLALWTM